MESDIDNNSNSNNTRKNHDNYLLDDEYAA